jgi:hypothetical protein
MAAIRHREMPTKSCYFMNHLILTSEPFHYIRYFGSQYFHCNFFLHQGTSRTDGFVVTYEN